uniref:VIT domain-containing protein n=1 Tax=Eptatretus burgeri TaxID=7764 RepID=A0A8C4QMA6_EPTBU
SHRCSAVPLKSVDVTVTARGFVADVAAELAYVNSEAQAVEIEYVFPIDAGWSVYRFSAEIDGKVINAELQEKQQAQETYDDAVSEGRVAFLLEESGAASDVLRCLLGRLGPGVTAQLKFGMVGELQGGELGSAKFRLPAVLNPRYCPAGELVSLDSGFLFDRDVELELMYRDGERPVAIVEAGDTSSLDEALAHVKVMCDLGGTEILGPLQHVYRQPEYPGFPRQLFILTDGEVGNTRDVIAEVERNAHAHRCFSFGIGAGASTDLVRGLAKAGGGIAEFVSGSDRLQAKVLGALNCALQPVLTDISFSWHLPSTLSAVVTPRVPSNIFLTQRTVLYAHLKGEVPQDKWEGDAVFTYKLREKCYLLSYRLALHRLAARSHLSDLLYPQPVSDEIQKKALSLSLAAGIVCPYTAFVGTSTDTIGKATSDMPLIRVPRQMMCSCCFQCDHLFHSQTKLFFLVVHPLAPPKQSTELNIVQLQRADGSWELKPELAQALSLKLPEIEAANNPQWATVLALVWLHGQAADSQDEWGLLARKAYNWLKKQGNLIQLFLCLFVFLILGGR